MTPEQIQFLLKERNKVELPEGYANQLVKSLHERQRRELLSQPLWRIGFDRVSTFLSEHSLSTPRYALGLAALVAFFLGVIALLKPSPGGETMARQDKSSKLEDGFRQGVEARPVSFEK